MLAKKSKAYKEGYYAGFRHGAFAGGMRVGLAFVMPMLDKELKKLNKKKVKK